MVIDILQNWRLYATLHPDLEQAFQWLASTDLASLPDGKTPLPGGMVASTSRGRGRSREEGIWEAHKAFIDVQYVAEGIETMLWAPLASSRIGTYNPDKDFLPLEAAPSARLEVSAGQFAIFFPGDAHMPGLASGQPGNNFKVVVKVPVRT